MSQLDVGDTSHKTFELMIRPISKLRKCWAVKMHKSIKSTVRSFLPESAYGEFRPRIAQARGDDGANGDESLIAEDEDGELTSLAALPDEVAELGIAEPAYDEEEDLGDDADAAEHAAVVERELRRRARLAKAEPEPPPRPPRRRAVIVAHADRDSLMAAIVLARRPGYTGPGLPGTARR